MYQAFSLLVVLIACASIVVGNGTQIIDWHALNDAEPNQDDSHIQFILYNRKLREGTTDMTHLKKKLHTYVLIHGFNDNLKDSIMLPLLTKNYLDRERSNVVVVDWAEFAKGPWFINAAKNTLLVGKELAAWLDNSGLDMKRVTLVGFSMGAHVAGDAGHFAQKRIYRIVALDPAHFLFQNSPPEFRLDSTDAEIVEVVHTSGGYVGEKEALGTRDFFPNGGTYPQPGCSPDPTGTCSHRRAYYYYSEAISKPDDNFKGRRCNSYDHFVKHKCREKGIPIILHLVNTNKDKHLSGNFYFMTNSKEPFIRRNVSRNATSTTERHPVTTDKHRTTKEKQHLTTADSRRSTVKEHSTTSNYRTTKDRQQLAIKESNFSNVKEHMTTDKHRPAKDKHQQDAQDSRRSTVKEHSTTSNYGTTKDRQQLAIKESHFSTVKEHMTTDKHRPAKDKHQQDAQDSRRSTVKEHLKTDKYRMGKDEHRLTTTDRLSTLNEHWTTYNYRTSKDKQLDMHQSTVNKQITTDKRPTTLKRRSTWTKESPTPDERLTTERHRYIPTDGKTSSKYKSTVTNKQWTTPTKWSDIAIKRRAKIGKGKETTTAKRSLNVSVDDEYL